MSNLDFRFIGWCHEPRDNHDKVWGVIRLDNDVYGGRVLVFWGRRGKKLQTKLDHSSHALNKTISHKESRGYKSIDKNHLDAVYPEFQEDLEKTVIWAILIN